MMRYQQSVGRTVKQTVRNPVPIVGTSLLWSAALVPLVVSVAFGSVGAVLVGLWSSSLLLGIVLAGAFNVGITIANKGETYGMEAFWQGVVNVQWGILTLGFFTFGAAVFALALLLVPFEGIIGTSLRVTAVYVVIAWWLTVAFGLPLYSTDQGQMGASLRKGWELIFCRPSAALWLLVQTAGWSALAVLTIVTPFVLLPGFLAILATNIAHETEWSIANGLN